jgi:hypothetical protein
MSPNPMMDVLRPLQAMPAQNPLAGIFSLLKNANNPMAMLQNMAMTDPRIQEAIQVIQQNGGNPQQAFYAEAQRLGINPADTLRQAQSMMM